jgi:CheY-like chemotaxis protein
MVDRKQLDPLSSLSHKVRTPLTVIISTVGNFLDGAYGRLSDQQRTWLKKLETHTTHLEELVTEILSYLRAHPDEAEQVDNLAGPVTGKDRPSVVSSEPAVTLSGGKVRKKPLILVVDDEPDIRDVVREGLSSQGYEVKTASSGDEAFSLATNDPPDLILMDVHLKGQNGIEVGRRIKSNLSSFVPVLLITGQEDMREKVGGSLKDVDDLLSKPFQMVELFARVGSMIRLKKLSEEVDRLRKKGRAA